MHLCSASRPPVLFVELPAVQGIVGGGVFRQGLSHLCTLLLALQVSEMSKEELLKVLGPGNLPAWIGSPDCMRVSWVNDLLGESVIHGTGLPCHGPIGMACTILVRLNRCRIPCLSD